MAEILEKDANAWRGALTEDCDWNLSIYTLLRVWSVRTQYQLPSFVLYFSMHFLSRQDNFFIFYQRQEADGELQRVLELHSTEPTQHPTASHWPSVLRALERLLLSSELY